MDLWTVTDAEAVEGLIPGGAALLRSVAQESKHVAYLLAGSIPGMVTGLLEPRGPLYGTPSLEVGPMDPDYLATWIDDVLRDQGVLMQADPPRLADPFFLAWVQANAGG